MIMILLMNFQEWRMLLTTCWFMSAFVILIGYGDLIQGSDLMTNWSHMPLDFWLKNHVWSQHCTLKAKEQCDFSSAYSPDNTNVLPLINFNLNKDITRPGAK